MGTTPVKLANATDTWVYEYTPTKANGTSGTLLYVSGTTAKRCNSYLYFTLPFPKGVTIISAKMRLVQYTPTTGTIGISVARTSVAWSATKQTWNNRPATTGSVVTVSKTNPAHATVWEWDVTALMQTVSSGAKWYGFAVYTTFNGKPRFYSPSASALSLRPVLEVSWKDNPQKPSVMMPSNGRAVSLAKPTLTTNFIDLSGDTTMQSIQVRLFDTEAAAEANTTPTFDSGTVAADSPELDLAATAYAGSAADSVKHWRVRVQDGAGLWSDWSEDTSWTMKTKGTLTITNPVAGTVSDPTPPITWTFTGRTQKAYQVIVRLVDGARRVTTWDSGKITSTALNATPSKTALKDSTKTYEIIVRVWDTIDRESIPGDPTYVEAVRTVTYQYSASVPPATGLTGTQDNNFPWMKLDWSRSQMPDGWTINRDGKAIFSGEGDDLWTSGTAYTYTDRIADPRISHVWSVVAVVNGVGSASSPTVTKTIIPETASLSAKDGSNPVLIWNYDHAMGLAENSAVHQPTGSAPPVLITQSEHGYQGHIKGVLAASPGVPSMTAAQWRDRFNQLKKNNGTILLLTIIDLAFECFLAGATVRPIVIGPGVIDYEVEFDFYQTDWTEV